MPSSWRRRLALIALGASLLCAATCANRPAPSRYSQRLVILGFDGMDPTLLNRWLAAGLLPNIAKLATQGGVYPLETTQSPESPTAWASFATGVNPGKHNIYDFLVRDTSTYLPDLGMVRREAARVLFDYVPYAKTKMFFLCRAASFCGTAGKAGGP